MAEGEGVAKEMAAVASEKFNEIIKYPRAQAKR
jgi:hypothetical protein